MSGAMRRAALTSFMLFAGCSTPTPAPVAASPEDSVRSAYARSLRVLAVDDRTAIARTERDLVVLARDATGAWAVVEATRLPEDWIDKAESGFSTYVDPDRLRASYDAYLDVVHRVARPEPGTVVSRDSRLLPLACNRWPLSMKRDDASGGRPGPATIHCTGAEGMYAFFVTDSGIVDFVSAGDCGHAAMGSRRLVVFRADDGARWLVYDERSLDRTRDY